MIGIISVFNDVNFQINKDGGYLPIPDFNALSKRGELKLLDYISGDVTGQVPPINGLNQKGNEWISKFITPYRKVVSNGFIDLPVDFYGYEDFFRINGTMKDCEGEKYIPNVPIEILKGGKFTYRANTYIEELKPSAEKPIAKMADGKIELLPKDIGSVQFNYIRLPKFGFIEPRIDDIYNDEVPDADASQDYEWDEWAREYLIFYIVDLFSNHIRENELKQFNQISHQSVK